MNPFSYAKRLLAETFGAAPEAPVQSSDPFAALSSRAVPAPPFNPMDPIGSTAQFRIGQAEPTLQVPQQPQAPQEPQAPQSPAKGFLQRMQDTPGMGLGLMQLGAGIASGKDWGEGIGTGFAGMADTLQKQKVFDYQQKQQELEMAARQEAAAETRKYRADSLLLKAQGRQPTNSVKSQLFIGKDGQGNPVRGFQAMRDGQPVWVHEDMQTLIDGAHDMNPFQQPRQEGEFRGRAPTWVEMIGPNGQPMEPVMQVATPDGDVWMMNGKPVPVEEGIRQGYKPSPTSVTERTMYERQAMGMEKGLIESEDTQVALNKFHDTIDKLPGGLEGFFNKFSAQAKSALGQYDSISSLEKDALYGDAQAQAMLGKMREAVVGGGTMTEYDALRVMEAIGGVPSGFTWNRDNALRLTSDALKRNRVKFNNANDLYQSRMGEKGIRWKTTRPDLWKDAPVSAPADAQTSTSDLPRNAAGQIDHAAFTARLKAKEAAKLKQ